MSDEFDDDNLDFLEGIADFIIGGRSGLIIKYGLVPSRKLGAKSYKIISINKGVNKLANIFIDSDNTIEFIGTNFNARGRAIFYLSDPECLGKLKKEFDTMPEGKI